MDKQRIGIDPRPTFLQVGYDRLTHFLGQWQSRVAAALTANLYRCIVTIHTALEPKYEEFRSRTIWSVSNAFTSGFKELEPIPQFKATAKLGEFLEARFSQSF